VDRILIEARFFAPAKTYPEAHPAFYVIVIGFLSRW
jgi:hypothetical protein